MTGYTLNALNANALLVRGARSRTDVHRGPEWQAKGVARALLDQHSPLSHERQAQLLGSSERKTAELPPSTPTPAMASILAPTRTGWQQAGSRAGWPVVWGGSQYCEAEAVNTPASHPLLHGENYGRIVSMAEHTPCTKPPARLFLLNTAIDKRGKATALHANRLP